MNARREAAGRAERYRLDLAVAQGAFLHHAHAYSMNPLDPGRYRSMNEAAEYLRQAAGVHEAAQAALEALR